MFVAMLKNIRMKYFLTPTPTYEYQIKNLKSCLKVNLK